MATKKEAVGIIHKCAALYNENLSGKNVLFVTIGKDSNVACFEALFRKQNFMHLTGVKSNMNSEFFYKAALNQRLSPSNISFDSGGTSELKLEALSQLMSIHTTARIVGDYDNSSPLLITDKLAGTVTMTMGFVKVNDVYIPNTALKKDLRDISAQATRRKIAAIFTKPRNKTLYENLTYIAKDLTIDDDNLASVLSEKIDKNTLTATFPIPRSISDS